MTLDENASKALIENTSSRLFNLLRGVRLRHFVSNIVYNITKHGFERNHKNMKHYL
jgi:hypothetical protein